MKTIRHKSPARPAPARRRDHNSSRLADTAGRARVGPVDLMPKCRKSRLVRPLALQNLSSREQRLEGERPREPIKSARPADGAKTAELAELCRRLAEAEETLHAIRTGEVDSVVVAGQAGPQVFTLQGADHAYRMLIESMNEGALTLTAEAVILYANQCFAKMVKRPLEQVMGSSFRRFLSPADRTTLRPLLQRAVKTGAKIQVQLKAGDGSPLPVQISLRPLARDSFNCATIGMVVTDLSETRRTEERLRALAHRVVQVQETERGRVARELHDNITQLLCATLFRSQALEDKLERSAGTVLPEATKLHEMLSQTAAEVERISRHLRPGILEQLGLVAVLRETGKEFTVRTGVPVKLASVPLPARLPADIELALYRIFQETLNNVEKHARAHHVAVSLKRPGAAVQMMIADDGGGFTPERHTAKRKGQGGLGLLGMHERATAVGGTLTIESRRRAGTTITVRIPLPTVSRES